MNTFTLILVIATLVTACAYGYDFFFKRKERLANYQSLLNESPNLTRKERKKLLEPKGIIGQLASLFPIILFVFIFRSFIIEPFRIPSGSMMPTLLSGDFIAVTKWSYGLKNPLTNKIFFKTNEPKRGDVIVFKYPEDPKVDFIKRIVGMPGDTITYINKTIYLKKACIDEQCSNDFIEISKEMLGDYMIADSLGYQEKYQQYSENLDGIKHDILINPQALEPIPYYYRQEGQNFATWVVPEGNYFVMGDNRDNSRDSRFWGFVSKDAIVGKTIGIWLSLGERPSDSILPKSIPTLRFERLGSIN